MKEVFHCFTNRLFVVYECFHDLCGPMDWDEVIIGYCGWYETGGLCGHEDFIACGTDTDSEGGSYIHYYNEGVVLYHIPMEGLMDLHYLDAEEGGVKKLIGFAYILFMWCLVFGIDSIVDGLCRQFGMELTWLAIKAGAVIVEDAIGDI